MMPNNSKEFNQETEFTHSISGDHVWSSVSQPLPVQSAETQTASDPSLTWTPASAPRFPWRQGALSVLITESPAWWSLLRERSQQLLHELDDHQRLWQQDNETSVFASVQSSFRRTDNAGENKGMGKLLLLRALSGINQETFNTVKLRNPSSINFLSVSH